MSRACCCFFQGGPCPVNWGGCTTPVKMSLTGTTWSEMSFLCNDTGAVGTSSSSQVPVWQSSGSMEFDRSIAFDLQDLEWDRAFGTIDPLVGDEWYWTPRASGTLTFTIVDTCDTMLYDPTSSGPAPYNCTVSVQPGGTAAISQRLDLLDPDYVIVNLSGYIRAVRGADGICRMKMFLNLEFKHYDGFDYVVLGNLSTGTLPVAQTNLTTDLHFELNVFAEAAYTSTTCIQDAAWSITQGSLFDHNFPYGFRIDFPTPAWVVNCSGAPGACDFTNVCYSQFESPPYVDEDSTFTNDAWSCVKRYGQDDPTISFTT